MKSQSDKDPVKRTGVSGVAFLCAKFTVKFTDRNMRIASVIVLNPLQLLRCMSVRVQREWSVGFIHKGFLGAVIAFVPAHKRGLGNFITPANKGDTDPITIKFNGMVFCNKFMWQISL